MNPANLHRSRFTAQVTVTVTGNSATLDGATFPLGSTVTVRDVGFHELVVTEAGVSTSYKFIVRNPERGNTEDGIPTLKPLRGVLDAPEAFRNGELSVVLPSVYPKNLPIPVVARLTRGGAFGPSAGAPLFLNGWVQAEDPEHGIRLRRGWGSTILPPAQEAGRRDYQARLHGLFDVAPLTIEDTTTWVTQSGEISGVEDWGRQARIYLTHTLKIGPGGVVTIGAGSIVRCAPGVEIWVRAGGRLLLKGSTEEPVVLVPDNPQVPWGGIWLQPQSGTAVAEISATGAIFCCWGANQNWFATAPSGEPARNFPHHRNQQPCIAAAAGSSCTLTDCALVGPTGLTDIRGTAFAANGGSLVLDRVLMQRCITGGEMEGCPQFNFRAVAVLEMTEPGVDVDGEGFVDADNDGLYLVPRGRRFELDQCLVGWTLDDGIDTGADGDGTVVCRNCWFENVVHEAISNSGVDRIPQLIDSVNFNCGQGMECGYGGPHSLVERSLITACMVGARYGDNYGNGLGFNGTGTSQYDGEITVRDSLCLYNFFHDTWAIDFSRFEFQNQRLILTGSKVTSAVDLAVQNGPEDADNSRWNPGLDAERLKVFMPVPGSDVGVDFPVGQRQGIQANFPKVFTVRLSTFSAQPVSCGWEIVGKTHPADLKGDVLASGRLHWEPGETVRDFATTVPVVGSYGLVVVRLTDPSHAAVTGSPLWYVSTTNGFPVDRLLVVQERVGASTDHYLLWADPILSLQSRGELAATPWGVQPDRTSPVRIEAVGGQRFFRLVKP